MAHETNFWLCMVFIHERKFNLVEDKVRFVPGFIYYVADDNINEWHKFANVTIALSKLSVCYYFMADGHVA